MTAGEGIAILPCFYLPAKLLILKAAAKHVGHFRDGDKRLRIDGGHHTFQPCDLKPVDHKVYHGIG